jgi:hypothetical protein
MVCLAILCRWWMMQSQRHHLAARLSPHIALSLKVSFYPLSQLSACCLMMMLIYCTILCTSYLA